MPAEWIWVRTGIPPKCKLSKWRKAALKARADQFVEDAQHLPAHRHVKGGGRLVGDDKIGFGDQHHGNHDRYRDNSIDDRGPEQHGNRVDIGRSECATAERRGSNDCIEPEGSTGGSSRLPRIPNVSATA